jgi:hypothetical protein
VPESKKLQSLRDLRTAVDSNRLKEAERANNVIADTNGRHVRLGDPDILAVIDRRIAAEEGESPGA